MKVITFALLLINILHAASFDCNKALTKTERLICVDSELSKLDDSLASNYKNTKKMFSSQDISTLKNDQRDWMKDRNKCSSPQSKECLVNVYEERIKELKQYQVNYNLSSNKYETHSGNSEAYIDIHQLSANKYLIHGDAFYGVKNKYGPNIGTINFISDMKSNKIVQNIDDYQITLTINKNKINIQENGPGPFGMNVSFSGSYMSVQNTHK